MIETILVLTLFNFLFIITGMGIYIYKFIIKYVSPKFEAKRIEREKLIEEYNKKQKDAQIESNQKVEEPSLSITPIVLDVKEVPETHKEEPKDNVQV